MAKKYLIGPVMKIVSDRQKEIDTMYADADAARTEAETMKAEYTKKLSEAQAASDRMVREAVARGQAKEYEILSNARRESDHIKDKAYQDIELERKKARNELKGEISDLAVHIAAKVVEREITPADHAQLIDEFISGMGDGT